MNEEKNVIQDRRSYLSLKNLFLDPNNYRFIESEVYKYVPEDRLTDDEVQRRTINLIIGKNGEQIRDLIDSFKRNGFLPVDQIQVRQLGGGKYLVVEGNRRVACLKWLQGRYNNEGIYLGKLSPEIFSRVPVVYYEDADETHHLILMGLKHISGNKKWPAINQAELVRSLYEKYNMAPDEICEAIALNKMEFNRIINTLALIDEYKKSDYGDQFEPDKYALFYEIIRSRSLRDWLNWHFNDTKALVNHTNVERLFSWLSQDEEYSENEEDNDALKTLEPVITRRGQIRELAKIIDDPKALDNLDITRNLVEATLTSDVVSKDRVKNAILAIGQEINTIFNISKHISDADRSDIQDLSQKLLSILELQNRQELSASFRPNFLFPKPQKHFSDLTIHKYRRLNEVKIEGLSRINLFAGINNSGKTSVLEIFKLVAALNNPRELIDLIKLRAKLSTKQIDMNWFIEQIPEILIEGNFDNTHLHFNIANESDDTIEDKTYYLLSTIFNITVGVEKWSSVTHFFDKYPQRTEGTIKSLCPSVFLSPFSSIDPDSLKECHSKSLKMGSKQSVVEFIKENIDSGITNIELNDSGRFTIIHDKLFPNPDLTKFGEGLQRIFKIGLLFAGAQNGIVLIDEFENAIHASLLPSLVSLVYELAIRFNVQVFISSHSKECIEAIVQSNKLPKDEISAYGLVDKKGQTLFAHFSGTRLSELIDTIDFDLRGGKIK